MSKAKLPLTKKAWDVMRMSAERGKPSAGRDEDTEISALRDLVKGLQLENNLLRQESELLRQGPKPASIPPEHQGQMRIGE